MSKAYWICPDESIIDIGLETHISYIINNPATFNTIKLKITELYKKYDEPLIFLKPPIIPIGNKGYLKEKFVVFLG